MCFLFFLDFRAGFRACPLFVDYKSRSDAHEILSITQPVILEVWLIAKCDSMSGNIKSGVRLAEKALSTPIAG
jgi:hypothetical protein